ncbi:MAG: coproporphyrinogen III oxidase [Rhizobiales bacterium]|nr:coproporphyrinogen III oxidase [Hyphomicrobiales bacterium]
MISSERDLAIYLHWPFCKAKCPYCDFNSHVRHQGIDSNRFTEAIARELEWFAAQDPGRRITSIFFGGGTPSLMPPAMVGLLVDRIASLWEMAPDVEATLEANPTSVEAENFRGYRAAGINRVSVGVQALDQQSLAMLGRQHSVDEALAAYRLAAKIFPRSSFDLIYARPGQTVESWTGELSQALCEQQGHMSLYQLTIEPDTAFARLHAEGKLAVPNDETAAALYEVTQDLTEKAGLAAYEVSNHARAGDESRHNLHYWNYGEYAGVGPGAHSRFTIGAEKHALATERHPETWLKRVTELGNGIITDETLSGPEQADEMLLMGMRVSEGIDLARYERLAGRPLDQARINNLAALGLVAQSGTKLQATPKGRRLLNAVIGELAA